MKRCETMIKDTIAKMLILSPAKRLIKPKIDRVLVEVTTSCNLRCTGCYRTEHSDNYTKPKSLSISDFKKFIDGMPKVHDLMLWGFGEPLLHQHLTEMIHYAKNTDKIDRVIVTSNLMHKNPDIYDSLFLAGLTKLNCSVNSITQKEADLTRTGCDMKLVLNNLRYIIKQGYLMKVHLVVSKINIHTFSNTAIELIKLGVKEIDFPDYIDLGNTKYCTTQEEKEYLNDQVCLLRLSYPHIKLNYTLCKLPLEPCWSPTFNPVISVDGYVGLCCYIIDKDRFNAGNLHDKTLSEIYYSKEYTKIQKDMTQGKYPEICKDCYYNHSRQ
jgi:radical SAM protein with 4Fe4S-binding SPASM domain